MSCDHVRNALKPCMVQLWKKYTNSVANHRKKNENSTNRLVIMLTN